MSYAGILDFIKGDKHEKIDAENITINNDGQAVEGVKVDKFSERVVQVKKYDTLVEVIKNCNIKNCHGWIGVEKLTGEPKLTEIKNLIDENRPIAVSREEFMIWMLLALDELNCFKEYGKNFVDQ